MAVRIFYLFMQRLVGVSCAGFFRYIYWQVFSETPSYAKKIICDRFNLLLYLIYIKRQRQKKKISLFIPSIFGRLLQNADFSNFPSHNILILLSINF